jgi:hypothetical protein
LPTRIRRWPAAATNRPSESKTSTWASAIRTNRATLATTACSAQIELEPSELERIAHDEKVHRHAGTADLVREGFDELDEGL